MHWLLARQNCLESSSCIRRDVRHDRRSVYVVTDSTRYYITQWIGHFSYFFTHSTIELSHDRPPDNQFITRWPWYPKARNSCQANRQKTACIIWVSRCKERFRRKYNVAFKTTSGPLGHDTLSTFTTRAEWGNWLTSRKVGVREN